MRKTIAKSQKLTGKRDAIVFVDVVGKVIREGQEMMVVQPQNLVFDNILTRHFSIELTCLCDN